MHTKSLLKSPIYSFFISFMLLFSSCSDDENTGTNSGFEAEVSISSLISTQSEAIGALLFTISLDKVNNSQDPLIISYDITGTANLDTDYTDSTGSINIASGENQAILELSIVDDTEIEEDESIVVTLSNMQVNGITVGQSNSISITITDNDISADCSDNNDISTTNIGCDTEPTLFSEYIESVLGDERTITTNTYPNHRYTTRDVLTTFDRVFTMDATPVKAGSITQVVSEDGRPARFFGVALNGVLFAPAPAQPFIFENTQTGEYNWDWVFEATNNMGNGMGFVALDCATAHLGPQGYHYHGNMVEYAETIATGLGTGTVPSAPVQVGWASDGFPILYLYGPDASGNLTKLTSGYQLKSGERPGNGVSSPCGQYSGKYTEDYEYVQGLGDLDACNGVERNITLNTAQGVENFSYFYVITENFPQVSRCMVGTPNTSFDN